MTIKTFARRVTKVALYFFICLIVGRLTGNPELWFDHELADRIAQIVYGPGEIGADNFFDLYTYISVITLILVSTPVYVFIMIIIKKVR